jgi:hypothetical protein
MWDLADTKHDISMAALAADYGRHVDAVLRRLMAVDDGTY